jgi:sulfur-oxidizing protein SoxX
MQLHGSTRSQRMHSAMARIVTLIAACVMAQTAFAHALEERMSASLTSQPGEPARGRAIIVDRQKGLCLLCHTGPFAEQRFQGNLAPDLAGVGSRLDAGQLRLRIADSSLLNRLTIMPSYYKTEGLNRVGAPWREKTILSAQEIEDVVAFLTTLIEPQTEGGRK